MKRNYNTSHVAPKLNVTKASGKLAPYSHTKLKKSLMRSGLDSKSAAKVVRKVEEQLYEGITTRKLYQSAFSFLKRDMRHAAGRYRLKEAIFELGPAGFIFEKFISQLLHAQGFQVSINQVVKGLCVTHEVDIVGEKGGTRFMIECKFHHSNGIKCDVKIPLYVQARFKDIETQWLHHPESGVRLAQGWLVTNTKFTEDALQYGNCAGLILTGWSYPMGNSLKEMIDRLRMYPVTCLSTITRSEKSKLLEDGILLCSQLETNDGALRLIGIGEERIPKVLEEVMKIRHWPSGE